jgi:ESX secretion system ATPase EccB
VQNRKDLLQAHRLMTQRSALALICGEPDSPNQPLRRLNLGTISSVLVGAIAAGVFAVLGLIAPGSASGLTRPGTLVIDSATATAYVPCDGGKLCPALNEASALLALDSASVRRVNASQASLSHYSIGPTIGVAGLPQDLPAAGDLVSGPWAVCAASGVTTLVGGRAVGGTALGATSAELATTGRGGEWVLWNGARLLIDPQVAQTLFPAMQVQTVPLAWLDALPQGPDFTAPQIPGQGTVVTGPGGAPATAGQVYGQPSAGGAAAQYYVLLASGKLAQISATQAQLLEREPGAPAQRPISPSMATGDLSGTPIPAGGLPSTVPALAPVTSALCVRYGPGLQRQVITGGTVPTGATPAGATPAGATPAGATPAGATSAASVSQVWLPPAHGALVGAAPGGTASGVTSYFLVTGATRYALSSQGVAAVLGYDLKTQATALPAALLDLLPSGPALNPAAATAGAATPAASG